MSAIPNGCCHPPADHSKHIAHANAASAPLREAAERVSAWLDSNWKYVSDDLAKDLRLLASSVPDALTRPAEGGDDRG